MIKVRDLLRGVYWSLPSPVLDFCQQRRSEFNHKGYIYRSYFDTTNSIYIHIPKVAGKSISFALYGEDPRHQLLSDFQALDPKKYDNYFKFAFVRNPWSKLYSAYNYLVKQNKEFPYGKYRWLNKYGSFQEFCLSGLSQNLVEDDIFFYKQVSYVQNLNGEVDTDFIGKFENLENDFQFVCEKLQVDASLPIIGKTGVKQYYTEAYNQQMIDIVAKLYSDDIDTFGYDFS